jgi:glycosyltransferase involved in cell wall biosynthesis
MISVITPSFQQLKWLKLCAASVADQEGVQHEHIVQDAGSGAELENWARTVPSLSLYVEKDASMYDAINRGLAKARGDVCTYLNCDEQYLPNALAKVVNFFTIHPEIEVLFGDSILIDKSGRPLSYRRTVLPILSHVRHVQLNAPTCSTFFRRSIVDRGFRFEPQLKVIGDQVWIESMLRAGVRMTVLPEALAVFTFTGENLSATAISDMEDARRRGPQSLMARLVKTARVIWHRIRKLFGGAYRLRDVDIEIYTLESPSVRQRLYAKNVGFRWPEF